MEFEWDPDKAAENLRKHGVTFPEAMAVFADPLEVTIPDPDHSDGEFRFLSLGKSGENRLLVVSYIPSPDHQRTRSKSQGKTRI